MELDLVLRRLRAIAQNDECMRRLTPFLVRHTDHGDFLDGRVMQQTAFHLDRGNILAAADDDILEAIPNLKITIGVNHSGIT